MKSACIRSYFGPHFLEFGLREKCPNSELFWSAFSRIRTEYGEMRSFSPYSVRMWKMRTRITPNTDTFHAVKSYKYPYSELFWSAFSRIRTEYGEILSVSVFSPNAEKCGPEELRIRTLLGSV